MALWVGKEFAAAINGELHGKLPQEISGISIDSRSLQKGDAFFAIKGEHVDGHDYLSAAIENGATILVIDKKLSKDEIANLKAPIIQVDSVQKALENLAVAARDRLAPEAEVAAITGSVGKTTVKEMLACLLKPFGKVHASPASFNNHWGVPLSLARMPQDTAFAVFEIGMNHAGEITPLTKMVRPKFAIITRIAPAHMGNFNSLDEIALAKAEIFAGLEIDKRLELGGTAILNHDDAYFEQFKEELGKAGHHFSFSFGRHRKAYYHLMSETKLKSGKQSFIISCNGKQERFHLAAEGAAMAENACCAVAAAAEMIIRPKRKKYVAKTRDTVQAFKKDIDEELQPDWHKMQQALDMFQLGAGRGARYALSLTKKDGNKVAFALLDESYNANPLSMQQAIQSLANIEVDKGRRIAVLGDMLELGKTAEAAHEALKQQLLEAKIDCVYLIGQHIHVLDKALKDTAIESYWQETTTGLADTLMQRVEDGDVIMVKGSNSIGLGAVVKKMQADCK